MHLRQIPFVDLGIHFPEVISPHLLGGSSVLRVQKSVGMVASSELSFCDVTHDSDVRMYGVVSLLFSEETEFTKFICN